MLFDLDGVLTVTATVHARCWKRMFDDYLLGRADVGHEPWRPFELPADYRRFVDGKPRYDGVRSFLTSRGIPLSDGEPTDEPTAETVCGLGNRKSAMFHDVLRSEGVETYPGSVAVVQHLRARRVRAAVVSSSRNCKAILDAAGIADLFAIRIDGLVAERLGLAGKPSPDTFLHAVDELGVVPSQAAVVEDAIAGVEAGRAGGFGLVVGIDRGAAAHELTHTGADVVVADLGETLPDTGIPTRTGVTR